ncbi:MAG: PD-(D/E)XK nuclease family protein [Rectinema sp.]
MTASPNTDAHPGDRIGVRIGEGLGDRHLSFVFPSQIAADAWASAVCRMPGVRSVETARFLGWDAFRNILSAPACPEDREPANDASRLLWAAGVMESRRGKSGTADENGAKDLSPAFLGFFARIAPELDALAAACSRSSAVASEPTLRGYLALRADYSRFLETNSLYEPESLDIGSAPKGERYVVFAPELLPGWAAVAASPAGEAIEAFPADFTPSETRLVRFDDTRKELAWVFSRCARLLDSGIHPSDLAISLPSPDPSTRAQLVRSAGEFGLRLSFRWSEPLTMSPFGTLLRTLSSARADGRSLASMRAFLGARAIPWKDPEAADKLLAFGLKYRILKQTGKSHRDDIWEKTFSLCPHDPGLRAYYRKLKGAMDGIAQAADFAALRGVLHDFRDVFLDESSLPAATVRTTERIMDELEMLDAAARRLKNTSANRGTGSSRLDAFGLFMTRLSAARYLPKGDGGTIPVYPYGISTLLPAKAHFILESSQTGLHVSGSPFDFLGKERGSLLDEGAGSATGDPTRPVGSTMPVDPAAPDVMDFSAATAAACAAPGNAIFCHADKGFSGWTVPHPCFLGWGMEGERKDAEAAKIVAEAPSAAEAAAWEGSGRFPASLFALQRAAALGDMQGGPYPCLTVSGASRVPAGTRTLGPEAVAAARALRAVGSENGMIRFSASSLRAFSHCSFAWFMNATPGARDREEVDEAFPATVAGDFAHSAVRAIYDIIRRDGPYDPARSGTYKRLVPQAAAEALERLARRYGPFVVPMAESWLPLLCDRLERLIDAEAGLAGWEAGDFEHSMSMPLPGSDILLEGRADRIANRGNTEYLVVDFKKKRLPKPKDILVDSDGAISDFQIAAYVELCEHEKIPVSRAWYWSLEDAESLVVFGPGGLKSGPEEYRQERQALIDALTGAAVRIRGGHFLIPDPVHGDCEECGWRAACRALFVSERSR